MCVILLYSVFLDVYDFLCHCLFEYMCTRLPFISWSIAGVPSSQALPGYLITAPPSVCVPDVISALAMWIQQQKKKIPNQRKTALRTLGAFPALVGGAPLIPGRYVSGQLGTLIVGTGQPENTCQPTNIVMLFYPLGGDLIGSVINQVMLRFSGPGQVLGSYVANQVLANRLVQ